MVKTALYAARRQSFTRNGASDDLASKGKRRNDPTSAKRKTDQHAGEEASSIDSNRSTEHCVWKDAGAAEPSIFRLPLQLSSSDDHRTHDHYLFQQENDAGHGIDELDNVTTAAFWVRLHASQEATRRTFCKIATSQPDHFSQRASLRPVAWISMLSVDLDAAHVCYHRRSRCAQYMRDTSVMLRQLGRQLEGSASLPSICCRNEGWWFRAGSCEKYLSVAPRERS